MGDLDRYGPDTEMAPGGKALICSMIAHRSCTCESLRKHYVSGMCNRCLALDYIKKHWPWWYFTTIGNMGANNES